jgi:branched-chain amino acid transport system ATP-binding protein
VALLDVRDVSVRFGGHMAVINASLDVDAGRVTGLIGPNGAGKTTLFNVISGLQQPVSGRVLLNGIDITSSAPHERSQRGIARTFQRIELFGSLTVRENLQVAAEIKRAGAVKGSALDERVDATLEQVGLAAIADKRADTLSTGQARLAELGRALVTRPKVLLLDEPASGLDGGESDELAQLLRELADQGLAVLLVEHDIQLVMAVCQTIHVLNLGKIIAAGTAAEIQQDKAVVDAYLGTPSSATAPAEAGAGRS